MAGKPKTPTPNAAPALGRIYTAKELAALLGVSMASLSRWRSLGRGPRFIKPTGRDAFYKESDVSAWLEERAAMNTAEARHKTAQLRAELSGGNG